MPDLATPPNTAGEPAGLSGITAAHNVVRANASPTPSPALLALTWSTSAATQAESWAAQCQWKHSGANGFGENIYASAGQGVTGQKVVDSWAGEDKDYNYETGACSGVCGHYTQIVWRKTTQLGCAVHECSTGSPFSNFPNWTFVVCNYTPPGNSGGKPY